MKRLLGGLDDLLRGRKTTAEKLAEGTADLPIGPHVLAVILLGVVYGAAMGLFSTITRDPAAPEQMLASAAKIPALFLLTVAVTFPSLYVFSALLHVRVGPRDALRAVFAAIAVNLAVLASFAPITAFFTLCTTSYPFMKLLNVAFFGIAGVIGVGFLGGVYRRLESSGEGSEEEADEAPGSPAPPLPAGRTPPPRRPGRLLFKVWVVLYVIVGAQMGWVLRPFVGDPDLPFSWFRERRSNFLVDFFETVKALFAG
jgi:hypothetical protein